MVPFITSFQSMQMCECEGCVGVLVCECEGCEGVLVCECEGCEGLILWQG